MLLKFYWIFIVLCYVLASVPWNLLSCRLYGLNGIQSQKTYSVLQNELNLFSGENFYLHVVQNLDYTEFCQSLNIICKGAYLLKSYNK